MGLPKLFAKNGLPGDSITSSSDRQNEPQALSPALPLILDGRHGLSEPPVNSLCRGIGEVPHRRNRLEVLGHSEAPLVPGPLLGNNTSFYLPLLNGT